MTNQIIPFSFDGTEIRTLERNGEPWFIARDVATQLGYANPRDAVIAHCKKAQPVGGVAFRDPIDPQTKIIPESDVYRLVMRSKLESAERFQDWVCEQVIPQIRKTGTYKAAQAPAPQFTQLEALRMAVDGWERSDAMLHESQAHVEKLVDMVVEMEPEVEAYRRLAGLNGSFCLTDAAKALKISPRWFANWLDKNKWIYRRRMVAEWTANQTKIDAGYLTTISTLDAANILRPQCRVTPKGMAKLSKIFAELVKSEGES